MRNFICSFTLSNLRFGKVDLLRFPEMARQYVLLLRSLIPSNTAKALIAPLHCIRYKIDTSSFSRQLPTVVLFKGGREVDRRPNENNRFNKYFFTRVHSVHCSI